MRKYLPYLFPIAFITMLLFPLINSGLSIFDFERTQENRNFRDSINININNLDAFPKEFEEYFNDNFSFRTPLLKTYHWNKYYTFHISPHPEKTIIGKNGWFFMAQEELKIYEGKKEFTPNELIKFDSIWAIRKHFLDSLQISSYWVIGPMKHYVYPEFLPFNINKKQGKSRMQTLIERIENQYPNFIINPLPKLIAAKDTVDLYFKLDNHWNRRAGFLVANLILETIGQNYPEIQTIKHSDYYWKDSSYYSGFHRGVVGINTLQEHDSFPYTKKEKSIPSDKYNFSVTPEFPYPNEFEKVYRDSTNVNGLKILVIRDSFSDVLIPFLKEPFKESVFIFDGWNYGLNKDIVLSVKPDIVVFLGLETHLEHYIYR